MSIEVKVPQLPESVADATLVAWHKKAGDAVRREENLVDLETDKVVLEVPAPADGVHQADRRQRRRRRDERPIARHPRARRAAAAAAAARCRPPPKAAPAAPKAVPRRAKPAPAGAAAGSRQRAGTGARAPSLRRSARRRRPTRWDLPSASSSRSTTSIPTSIAGSGREGRITKGDVLDYIADHQATTVGIEHEVLSSAGVGQQRSGADAASGGSRNEHRVAMTRLRARIAERLLQAQQQAAMLTTFNEVRHDGRHGAAPTLSRAVHGEARHQARLHVVLRQSFASKRCASSRC